MANRIRKKRKIGWLIFWLLLFFILFYLVKWVDHSPRHIILESKKDFWGVTYSTKLASSLGLDHREIYLAILDDLGAKNIRIPIYWDEIEKNRGEFDFSTYDFIFEEGRKRGVEFVANIGYRLPRWPECHAPIWLDQKNETERQQNTLVMIEMIVKRYQNRPEIVIWQVENEPLFNFFGECPDGSRDFLQKEVDLVRSLDKDRPILISASGELSTWRQEAKIGDLLGTTMYRIVWNRWFGYFHYPWSAWFYSAKAWLVGLPKGKLIISELQAEPWIPKGNLKDFPLSEAGKSMSLEQLKGNLQYAINTDLSQAYLWGVEWWYVQYKNGQPQYWSFIKNVLINAEY